MEKIEEGNTLNIQKPVQESTTPKTNVSIGF